MLVPGQSHRSGPMELDPSTYGAGVLAAQAGMLSAPPPRAPLGRDASTSSSAYSSPMQDQLWVPAAVEGGRSGVPSSSGNRMTSPSLPHGGGATHRTGHGRLRASTSARPQAASSAATVASVPVQARRGAAFGGAGATFSLPRAPIPHAASRGAGRDGSTERLASSSSAVGSAKGPSSRGRGAASKLPVWERLSLAHKAREAKLEAQRRAREQEAMADCTFAPGRAGGGAVAVSGMGNQSQQPQTRHQQRVPSCDSGAGLQAGEGDAPLQQAASAAKVQATVARLHADAAKRRRQRDELARAAKDAEAAAHPYRPTINADGAGGAVSGGLDATGATGHVPSDPRPLHERAFDLQRQKQEDLARRRIAAMTGDAELTFQPAISRRSSHIVHASRRGAGADSSDLGGGLATSALTLPPSSGHPSSVARQEDVSERLLREGDARKVRAARRKAMHAEEEAARLTFEPQVNEHSAKLVDENPSMRMGFLERQRSFLEARQRKIDAAKDAEAAQCTFKPKTRGADALLAYTRPELAAESERDRVERLARGDAERTEQLKQAISEEYYAQFQFKPKINGISKRLGRAHTVDEHHRDEQRRAAIARAKDAAEREEMRQCTFKPALQTDPDQVLRRAEARRGEGRGPFRLALGEDPDGLAARIGEHERRRQAKLRRMRRAQEFEELEACSFVPKPVARAPAASGKPVVVRGLARHLEKVELAEAKREEQQRREEEAFRVRGAEYKNQGETTVPQPFRLETESNPRRRARAARERAQAEAEAMKECRFRPDVGGLSAELEAELLEDVEEGETKIATTAGGAESAEAARRAAARSAAAALS